MGRWVYDWGFAQFPEVGAKAPRKLKFAPQSVGVVKVSWSSKSQLE